MGLRKMLSEHLPGFRYVQQVKRGTEAQQANADKLQKESAPIVENLKSFYVKNHFQDLVRNAFFDPLGRRDL